MQPEIWGRISTQNSGLCLSSVQDFSFTFPAIVGCAVHILSPGSVGQRSCRLSLSEQAEVFPQAQSQQMHPVSTSAFPRVSSSLEYSCFLIVFRCLLLILHCCSLHYFLKFIFVITWRIVLIGPHSAIPERKSTYI